MAPCDGLRSRGRLDPGLAGVAYATGSVPDFVSSAVSQFARDSGVPASAQPEMAQIADLTLPDGSRFAAWLGRSPEMECTGYIDNWNGRDALGSGGVGCGDTGNTEANRNLLVWARGDDEATYYPILFGDTDITQATQIHITGRFRGTGEPVDLTLPIDPATRAFAAVLPGTSENPWAHLAVEGKPFAPSGLSLSFVDASGAVLRTVEGPVN